MGKVLPFARESSRPQTSWGRFRAIEEWTVEGRLSRAEALALLMGPDLNDTAWECLASLVERRSVKQWHRCTE